MIDPFSFLLWMEKNEEKREKEYNEFLKESNCEDIMSIELEYDDKGFPIIKDSDYFCKWMIDKRNNRIRHENIMANSPLYTPKSNFMCDDATFGFLIGSFYVNMIKSGIKCKFVNVPHFYTDEKKNKEGICVSVGLGNDMFVNKEQFINNGIKMFLDNIKYTFENNKDIKNKTLYINDIEFQDFSKVKPLPPEKLDNGGTLIHTQKPDRLRFRYFYEGMKNN